MYKNELAIISIRPNLAYGEQGRRPDVPPDSRYGIPLSQFNSVQPSLAYGEQGRRPDVPPDSRYGIPLFQFNSVQPGLRRTGLAS
jgi:hypothetical protein